MSKRKSIQPRPRATKKTESPQGGLSASGENQAAAQAAGGMFSQAAIRETVESVVIAFVLAFLFRTFEAEAFVIPTGSMAPTLMGRHKDFECPICGHWYQVSASEEVDQETNQSTGYQVGAGTCPMCRYTADLRRTNPQGRSYPAYSGDRILVGKFAYQFSEPNRWDVAVFKYPGNAVTNYIKRIVGLPGETVIIRGGDIFTKDKQSDQPPEIARKPPTKLLAMLQLVFDNQYAPKLAARGFPLRWEGAEPPGVAGRFDAVDPDGCLAFQTDGAGPNEAWLRYQHRVPSFDDWRLIGHDGQLPPHRQPEPQFILDFTAYNTGRASPLEALRGDVLGSHWVGDLALECTVKVLSDTGEVILQLVEGGQRFQVRFDVATGQATLAIVGQPDWQPKAATRVRGPGTYHVRLANCDDKLYVWVNN
ncbi:MAG: signal peptidase I, partial [Patescibacteria group bacterium]|nr:signal peptidase I [Patescibacteria group bacterium]